MKFDYSKLKHRVKFYEVETQTENGLPGKEVLKPFHECWAHVETVWLKDYQTAVQNNTLNEIKIFIRQYPGITNKMKVKFDGELHNVKQVMNDYVDNSYMIVVAEVVKK